MPWICLATYVLPVVWCLHRKNVQTTLDLVTGAEGRRALKIQQPRADIKKPQLSVRWFVADSQLERQRPKKGAPVALSTWHMSYHA